MAAWSQAKRIVVDTTAAQDLDWAVLLRAADCALVFIRPDEIRSAIERLRALEVASRGWVDKIAIVWVLEDSGVAPEIPEVHEFAKREFKMCESPLPHPWGRVHSAGMERLVHHLRGVIGARKTRGKGWPVAKFCEVIMALHREGLNVAVFAGPEEGDRIDSFRAALDRTIPIVRTPSIRNFAAMLSDCDLFVTCDSGPMHLAYTLGVRTVAIFQYANFDRWGPPAPYVRVAYQPSDCSAEEVLRICREELSG